MAEERQTKSRLVRVPADLAEKLGWIADVEGVTVSDVLEPTIRPVVEARFERIRERAEIIKRARAGAEVQPIELGENGGA